MLQRVQRLPNTVKRALLAQFCTIRGIIGTISIVISTIGIVSVVLGRIQIGLLLLLASEVLALRLELQEIGKSMRFLEDYFNKTG